jgi:hypothetical protein
MAFAATDLSTICSTGVAPRLWSYNTADSPGVVKAADYFLPAWRQLRVGDFIAVESGNGSLITQNFITVVLICTSASVTTASKTIDL